MVSDHAIPRSLRVLVINTEANRRCGNSKWVLAQWTRSPDLLTTEPHAAASHLPESTAGQAFTRGLCNGRNMAELVPLPSRELAFARWGSKLSSSSHLA